MYGSTPPPPGALTPAERVTRSCQVSDRATRLCRSLNLSCDHDQFKMPDSMDRWVTPLKRVMVPHLHVNMPLLSLCWILVSFISVFIKRVVAIFVHVTHVSEMFFSIRQIPTNPLYVVWPRLLLNSPEFYLFHDFMIVCYTDLLWVMGKLE